MSPPLSAPVVTVVIPVMNEAKDLPRLFDRMTDGLRVPGVVLSGCFRCIGALPIDIRPRAPLDLIHSTSIAARVTTRACESLS